MCDREKVNTTVVGTYRWVSLFRDRAENAETPIVGQEEEKFDNSEKFAEKRLVNLVLFVCRC